MFDDVDNEPFDHILSIQIIQSLSRPVIAGMGFTKSFACDFWVLCKTNWVFFPRKRPRAPAPVLTAVLPPWGPMCTLSQRKGNFSWWVTEAVFSASESGGTRSACNDGKRKKAVIAWREICVFLTWQIGGRALKRRRWVHYHRLCS